MRPGSIIIAVVAAILLVSLVCIWFYPSVQDLAAANEAWNGIKSTTSGLKAESITSLGDLPDAPQAAALITIPSRDYSDEDLSRLRRFVEGGGRLVVMDDYGYGNRLLAYMGLGARFVGQALLDPLFCYQNQQMPRVTDFSPGLQEAGVTAIALNRATALRNVEEDRVIAWSSANSFLDVNGDGSWQDGEPRGPLPVAAELPLGSGTLAVVASPGMMINSMYDRDDNLPFLKYLTAFESGSDRIVVDGSRLSTSPLDVSKIRLIEVRDLLSNPYAVLAILLLVVLAVSAYALGKGEALGRSQ